METITRRNRMRLYSVDDVAKMFGVTRWTVHYWLETERFDGATRAGRKCIFPEGTRILGRVKPMPGPKSMLDSYVKRCEERGLEPTIPLPDWYMEEM